MATRDARSQSPLVVIVGPTASGKTSIAVELAERYNGEIICADSRTIYRGMDIGTAKPTAEDQSKVRHWGIDLINPGEYFTAVDFQSYAIETIQAIRKRGKVPFLVGGTGLYIDGVIFNFTYSSTARSPSRRHEIDRYTTHELINYCLKHNIILPINYKNRRHLVHAIETHGVQTSRWRRPDEHTFVVGIATDKITLNSRIAQRAEQIFDNNVIDEASRLGEKYGWENEAMTASIYPIIRKLIRGDYTVDEAKQMFIRQDVRLAKRQMTWFRRNPFVEWCAAEDTADYVAQLLAAE